MTGPERALAAGGLILFVIGLERLLNVYMLQGSEAVPTRLVVAIAFAVGGTLLVGAVAIMRRHRGPPVRDGCGDDP